MKIIFPRGKYEDMYPETNRDGDLKFRKGDSMSTVDKDNARQFGDLSNSELTAELHRVADTIRETSGSFDPGLVDMMMAQAIELLQRWLDDEEDERLHDNIRLKGVRGKWILDAVRLSIEHSITAPLARLRDSALLDHGNNLYLEHHAQAAIVLDDPTWYESVIQRVANMMKQTSQSHHYDSAVQGFTMVKQDCCTNYRQPLFDVIYRGRIASKDSDGHDPWYLNLLAEMAVYFKNHAWQDQVYQAAMKHLPSLSDGYVAYTALMILAPVHEASQQTIATTRRPPDVLHA